MCLAAFDEEEGTGGVGEGVTENVRVSPVYAGRGLPLIMWYAPPPPGFPIVLHTSYLV